jgi:hypothetical protein
MDGLKINLETNEKFLKQLGNKFETLDKLVIKKKDLPEEGMKVIVLETLR